MSLKKIILESISKNGKPSSSRIFAYLMMLQILATGLTYIGIEVTNAVIAIKTKGFYTIPAQHIAVFGMILGHQLALLGIYKYHEGKPAPTDPSVNPEPAPEKNPETGG